MFVFRVFSALVDGINTFEIYLEHNFLLVGIILIFNF